MWPLPLRHWRANSRRGRFCFMQKERWIAVVGFEGRYEISNRGRLRSIFYAPNNPPPPRYLYGTINKDGYAQVSLSRGSGMRPLNVCVHQLVANAFIKRPWWAEEVNHKNGVKTVNRSQNLEWTDSKGNSVHAARLCLAPAGERNGRALLSRIQVRFVIRNKGKLSQNQMAGLFRVSRSCIGHIVRGKNWTSKGSFKVSDK